MKGTQIMNTSMKRLCLVALVLALSSSVAFGFRGGGFRGGGFGGFHAGGVGGFRGGEFGGFHEGGFDRGSWSGARSFSGWSGARGSAGTESYNRSYTGSRGGSYDVSGTRGAAVGPYGAAAGGTRDVSATGPGGRTYSGSSSRGAAVGPGGAVAGGSRTGVATGPGGAVAGGSRWGAAATKFPTDAGFARYSGVAAGAYARPTAYWSGSYLANRAGYVRGGFYHYGAFYPGWYTGHPGAWAAAGWAAGAAWTAATVPALATFCAIPAPPVYYDYGNTVVYQNNNVYDNGADMGTAQQYEQQAAAIAQQGQQTQPPPNDKWQPLGVFALVQGEEKTSNTMFQLAINAEGVIRGNYYDGLIDSTTPVYGSVDKKTQRAAWTIGDKKTPLFEAGLFNLTKEETPVLVHFGPDKTQQWLLVRMQQPKGPPADGTKPEPAVAAATPAPAQLTVIVPPDADVFFDGSPTEETGSERVFTTPALAPGQSFYYEIEAQWSANGQAIDRTRKVTVTAGEKVTVDFTTSQP
jgi:uncharacterized protein (TIGR03000 family)